MMPSHSQHCPALGIPRQRDSDFPEPAKALRCLQHPSLHSKRPARVPSAGSITFVDRPAWIYIKEPHRHVFHCKKAHPHREGYRKMGKKTATAMHQSNFFLPKMTSCGLVLRFHGESETQTTYTATLTHAERSKGERRDRKTPKHTQASKGKKNKK